MNIKRYYCAALFAFAAQACVAQATNPEIVTTASGYGSNASGSLNWTIGEPLIETGSSSNCFLTQGFQQPPSIVITSLDNTDSPNGNIFAYPNPVTSSVFITSPNNEPLKVDVMDLAGKKLSFANLSGDNNQVDMSAYTAGIYLFRVYNTDGGLLQTLKIDKIK